MTGARSVAGGIATSNLNNLYALRDLVSEKGMGLEIFSYLEREKDRPTFLHPGISFTGFGKRKWVLAAALLLRLSQRPVFIFDHVRLALPLFPFAKFRLIKVVIFAHGSEAWKRMSRTSRWSFESASLCLANSQFTMKRMRERIAQFNGVACPLGLSPDFDSNGKLEDSSYNKLELEAADQRMRSLGKRVLLLVARMDSREGQKGHRALIKILPELLRKFPDVQLVFPGPGDDRENLRQLAQNQGVAQAVFIPGWVSHSVLRALYQHCYALIMPSQQEGFGLAYLEAMNYAKPCVGCFDQGAEEIIVDGETGFLIRDPNNPQELLEKVSTLLVEPELAERMGKKGFERLHQFFTSQQYQERIKEAISKVL